MGLIMVSYRVFVKDKITRKGQDRGVQLLVLVVCHGAGGQRSLKHLQTSRMRLKVTQSCKEREKSRTIK